MAAFQQWVRVVLVYLHFVKLFGRKVTTEMVDIVYNFIGQEVRTSSHDCNELFLHLL